MSARQRDNAAAVRRGERFVGGLALFDVAVELAIGHACLATVVFLELLHARELALSRRMGTMAREYALHRAKQLRLCGDDQGEIAWHDVAAHLQDPPVELSHAM